MRPLSTVALVTTGLVLLPSATALAEENEPPPALEVTVTPKFDPSLAGPGQTTLHIVGPAFWHLTVTVRAHGKVVLSEDIDGKVPLVKVGSGIEVTPGPTGEYETTVPWTCKPPATTYSYELQDHALFFSTEELTKTGTFAGATRRQCKRFQLVRQREIRQAARLRRARQRRERERALARRRRFEANCRAVGGKPVTIQTAHGPEIVCRSQTGGIIPVPD